MRKTRWESSCLHCASQNNWAGLCKHPASTAKVMERYLNKQSYSLLGIWLPDTHTYSPILDAYYLSFVFLFYCTAHNGLFSYKMHTYIQNNKSVCIDMTFNDFLSMILASSHSLYIPSFGIWRVNYSEGVCALENVWILCQVHEPKQGSNKGRRKGLHNNTFQIIMKGNILNVRKV